MSVPCALWCLSGWQVDRIRLYREVYREWRTELSSESSLRRLQPEERSSLSLLSLPQPSLNRQTCVFWKRPSSRVLNLSGMASNLFLSLPKALPRYEFRTL